MCPNHILLYRHLINCYNHVCVSFTMRTEVVPLINCLNINIIYGPITHIRSAVELWPYTEHLGQTLLIECYG